MKIALLHIDNRPVCYNLPKDTAGIDNNLEIFLPDRKFLGSLRTYANVNEILNWFEKIEEVDAVVVSLDTIAYGGLIASRRCPGSVEEIKINLQKFKQICDKKKVKIYAFSSVMRISNNNVNEEEKEYWNLYGTQIFEYSQRFHKEGTDVSEVPQEILSDYLATRNRNFQINKMYLEWAKEGFFNTLVFSKDDCAEFGFNVLEADILQRNVIEQNLTDFVLVKTGADEIPLALFARSVCDFYEKSPKIFPKFLTPEDRGLISNYEDISIEQSVNAQLNLANCKITNEKEADIILMINNFEAHQGEIVMGVKTKPFERNFDLPEKPFLIADVRFANGADNKFADKLLKKKFDIKNFYGYSGWNTSANTLGSLICAGVVRYFTKDFNEEAFKKLQMIRFLDDWAYQANLRQILRKAPHPNQPLTKHPQDVLLGRVPQGGREPRPNVIRLKIAMLKYENRLKKFLGINPRIKYYFPWKRFFEVGIIIK